VNRDFTSRINEYFSRLKTVLDRISRSELNAFMGLLLDALESGARIYIMGNGGSAATASHFAADFNKGLSYRKSRRFRMICLNDNIPMLTAYANDVSYDDVFVEPLRNFLEPNDLVVAISGSGKSRNVLNAIAYANQIGALTVGITGYDGGPLKKLAKHGVNVPIDDMQVTEDVHMMFDHLFYSIFAAILPVDHGNAGGARD
jgi:D-sedoheptulose 7-phosphate isomerase